MQKAPPTAAGSPNVPPVGGLPVGLFAPVSGPNTAVVPSPFPIGGVPQAAGTPSAPFSVGTIPRSANPGTNANNTAVYHLATSIDSADTVASVARTENLTEGSIIFARHCGTGHSPDIDSAHKRATVASRKASNALLFTLEDVNKFLLKHSDHFKTGAGVLEEFNYLGVMRNALAHNGGHKPQSGGARVVNIVSGGFTQMLVSPFSTRSFQDASRLYVILKKVVVSPTSSEMKWQFVPWASADRDSPDFHDLSYRDASDNFQLGYPIYIGKSGTQHLSKSAVARHARDEDAAAADSTMASGHKPLKHLGSQVIDVFVCA